MPNIATIINTESIEPKRQKHKGGHHDGDATVRYFEDILPFLSEGAILLCDDISWYEEMKRAWESIRIHKRVKTSLDLGVVGLCVRRYGLS